MKRELMRRFLCLSVTAGMIAGSMTACGKEKEAEAEQEVTEEEPEAAAEPEEPALSKEELYAPVLSPATIHPGSLNSTEEIDTTSDRWYEDGDTSNEHYFLLTQMTTAQSDIGLDIELGVNSSQLFSGSPLQGKDGHAVADATLQISGEDETFDFDLTFQDNFTCYNWATDTVWKRCHPTFGAKDEAWYDNAFAGNTAYVEWNSASYERIVFNADHTFVEEHDDDPDQTYTGTWEVKSSNVLWLHFDDPVAAGVPQPQGVDIAGEFLGIEIEEGENVEDIVYDVVPQEFEIDENGKITAFGVYPVYNTDGSMDFKATYCFGTEEEIEEQLAAKNAGAAGQPEDYNDLTAADLEGAPDVVVEAGDRDAASDLEVAMMGDDIGGKIVEIHGIMDVSGSSYYVVVQEEGTSKKTRLYLLIANKPSADELPVDDDNVVVKAIVWKVNGNWELVTDADHIEVE